MKQITYYGIVALAGLSLLACNKGQDTPFEEEKTSAEGRSYTIAIAPDTKSYLDGDHMTWDDDDAEFNVIGWFATATEYNGPQVEVSGFSSINLNANPRTFAVRTELGSIDAGQYIYAYYAPYAVDNESKTAAQLSIQTEQQGLLKNAMPMVSLPISVEDKININTNEAIGTARFVNLGAVIEYNVYTSNEAFADEKVIGVTFEASTPIAGNFTVDLTKVAEDAIPSPSGLTENTVYSSLDAPVTVGSSKDNGVKVYQVIAPGTVSGTITVTTDAALYKYTISNKDFNRGKIRPLNVDLKNGTRVERPYWHEFAEGDFGIGPVFNWGEWEDGYYFDMLTVPDVLDGASWSITDAGYFEWAGTEGWRKGIQLGTGGMTVSSFKLSSSSFTGVITNVILGYNSGITDGSSLSVSCSVGGNPFGDPDTVYHGDGDYEASFEGFESGEIEITVSSATNGAIYLYYLYVEYEPL